MRDTVEAVDYDNHPRFLTTTPSWIVDESLVTAFTHGYTELVSTGHSPGVDLEAIAQQVFASLERQTADEYERQFVRELGSDVLSMVRDHVNFYGTVVPVRPVDVDRTECQRCLVERGHYLTTISPFTLAKIRKVSGPAIEALRANAAAGRKSRGDLSVNSGRVARAIVRALNRDFKKSGVIESLAVIERQPIRVVGVALELSVPGSSWWKLPADSKDTPDTLYAHVDRSVSAPKSIVYLTDVEHDNGPTTCYPGAYENLSITGLQDLVGRCLETVGSNPRSPLFPYYQLNGQPLLSEKFRAHFMKLPASIRFNSHFGWDIVPGSAGEDFILSRQTEVIGPAGTTLVFDGGRLLHRGGLIQSGERIVLQVIFERSTLIHRVRKIVAFAGRKLRRM